MDNFLFNDDIAVKILYHVGKFETYTVFCGGLYDIHTGVVVAFDKLKSAVLGYRHVPAHHVQAGERAAGFFTEGDDLVPLGDLLTTEFHSGDGVTQICIATLVKTVGDYKAGLGIHFAEDATAMGVIHVLTVVSHTEACAKNLKSVVPAEGYNTQSIQRGWMIL